MSIRIPSNSSANLEAWEVTKPILFLSVKSACEARQCVQVVRVVVIVLNVTDHKSTFYY